MKRVENNLGKGTWDILYYIEDNQLFSELSLEG